MSCESWSRRNRSWTSSSKRRKALRTDQRRPPVGNSCQHKVNTNTSQRNASWVYTLSWYFSFFFSFFCYFEKYWIIISFDSFLFLLYLYLLYVFKRIWSKLGVRVDHLSTFFVAKMLLLEFCWLVSIFMPQPILTSVKKLWTWWAFHNRPLGIGFDSHRSSEWEQKRFSVSFGHMSNWKNV